MNRPASADRLLPRLLLATLLLVLPASAAANQIVIVPAKGTPNQNGTALLNTYNGITGASATNRFLVQLEPGRYSLQNQNLVMQDWVSLAGSGVDASEIWGFGNPNAVTIFRGLIEGADNTEIRDLTVRSFPATGRDYLVPIYLSGASSRISNVRTQAFGAQEYCGGIFGQGSNSHVEDAQVRSACPAEAVGLAFAGGSGSQPTILRVDVIASNNAVEPAHSSTGMLIQQGAIPVIRDSTIRGSGGITAIGLDFRTTGTSGTGTVAIIDTEISGRNGSTFTEGIRTESTFFNLGSHIYLKNSSVQGTSESGSSAGINHAAGAPITVDGGSIEGSANTVVDSSLFGVRVGAARMDGGPTSGSVTCAGVYDESFTFFPSTCP